ncbi:hypothetical protein SAMN04489761_1078 [Tenacibaculum sp. MAR_2009_124]|uniref:hypothetical protein n=1 Tax=Tenacibaculum sp. MAR_2009_124 TaxID=1250059 RepID=UPI00089D91BB|nr:hypothetical protein [Tenacibaculum sp. MAR_2009_124]SEB50219.1 hypothetical protein SAMN04489761_1078 [Tenacibaculum sp. MAR_2009_124]
MTTDTNQSREKTPSSSPSTEPKAKQKTKETLGISKTVVSELMNEINHMLSYAIYNGVIINTEVNSLIQNSSVDNLINAHNILVKNIAPVTPKSIEYAKRIRDNQKGKPIFNKIPLVRNLVILAIVFLVIFITTGLSPQVNNISLNKGIMNNSGISLLLNLTFLSTVSGLGVLFFLLKKISEAIKNTTLVEEEFVSYTAQILIGIIAGLIMSEIISFYSSDEKSITLFSKSILALIGGFSSDAIFSIIHGIINRIKSIFTSPLIK